MRCASAASATRSRALAACSRSSDMQSHRRSAFLAAAAAATAVAACPPGAKAQAAKLRIGCMMSEPLGQPFYAGEAGAFARAGFDIDVTSLSNAAAVVAAVGGGSLELGIGDLVSGVKAIDAGVPVLLIA